MSLYLLKDVKVLQSKKCGYYQFDEITYADFVEELTPSNALECDYHVERDPQHPIDEKIFNGYNWTRWTSEHWEIPLVACALYVIMLIGLKRYITDENKVRLQPVVICWNCSLSLFSLAGMYYCVPKLLFGSAGLFTYGWYDSVCAHSSSYGFGMSGFFVALFIYSKIAEFGDTFFLLVRKNPVILLHWYHHITVLLYCWHSYSMRIGTGLWFAAMNYTVHAIMYAYFALTQAGKKYKDFAKRFAMLITLMQLTQMVFGIAVTVSSVVYHSRGDVCHVSLINSGFGLAMYTSYFFLFLQLFLNHYVYAKKKDGKKGPSKSSLATAADATNKAHEAEPPRELVSPVQAKKE